MGMFRSPAPYTRPRATRAGVPQNITSRVDFRSGAGLSSRHTLRDGVEPSVSYPLDVARVDEEVDASLPIRPTRMLDREQDARILDGGARLTNLGHGVRADTWQALRSRRSPAAASSWLPQLGSRGSGRADWRRFCVPRRTSISSLSETDLQRGIGGLLWSRRVQG